MELISKRLEPSSDLKPYLTPSYLSKFAEASDGASQISKIVDRACALGMDSIALTDHGVMYGVLDLVKKCKEKGIKPIIGNEMYVINGSIYDPQPKKEKDIIWLY